MNPSFLAPAARLPAADRLSHCWFVAVAVALTACEEPTTPTAAQQPDRLSSTTAPAPAGVGRLEATPQGSIALPINQSVSTDSAAFGITQMGNGIDAKFVIGKATNPSAALYAVTSGTGVAGFLQNTRSDNQSPALRVVTFGMGRAGEFTVNNANNPTSAIYARTIGPGPVAQFWADGFTPAVLISQVGGGVGLQVQGAGLFRMAHPDLHYPAVSGETYGTGPAGAFYVNLPGAGAALYAQTHGTGWAGEFRGRSKGVRIITSSGAGLQVLGGSKQAVVATPSGARSLYTEESAEVWFTDYGFGRLEDGRARILLDPVFAQTIASEDPYHVFVQSYGDADLSVRERTALGFVVAFRGGSDRAAEFSYRVVAKRRGFERTRLEPAPWADQVPDEKTPADAAAR